MRRANPALEQELVEFVVEADTVSVNLLYVWRSLYLLIDLPKEYNRPFIVFVNQFVFFFSLR